MGSRMMHYVLAQQLSTRFPELNRNRFILGGIAPDAHLQDKERAHYYRGSYTDNSRRIDYEVFWQETARFDFSFRCGYFVHLIADDIWLQGFYKTWLKHVIAKDASFGMRYHEDFRRFNTVLALDNEIDPIELALDVADLANEQEVAALEQLLHSLREDLSGSQEQTYDVILKHQLDGYMASALEQIGSMLTQKIEGHK
ncbi:zinc dependent phospholipase C family protein [Exiguobacterium oxidotolerans]|uniref:Phospholipase C/D domain-containing protein n=1 Tax=Exiguobacterium oxidotolerans TaxID=223958 RepID=A0A653IEI2_9BACL|nr:zinc dependent phospholipase C family protein [Exiguobacterium oxidotolerans]VWX37659.1 conserved hypothetical protein [Exiguobacterium oxidotolerans]